MPKPKRKGPQCNTSSPRATGRSQTGHGKMNTKVQPQPPPWPEEDETPPSSQTPPSPTAEDADADIDEAVSGSGARPKWKVWHYEHLVNLVNKSQGAASKAVVYWLKSYMKGAKLIFVLGQTGTGKSTILRELTGLDLKVSEAVNSGTQKYHVCPALIDDKQYVFIDTPGFGAADKNDDDIFEDIISCLDALGTFAEVAGILLVCQAGNTRFTKAEMLTLQWAKCFCGPKLFQAVTVVTTMWDGHQEDKFKQTLGQTKALLAAPGYADLFSPPDRIVGGCVYDHGLPGGTCTEQSHGNVISFSNKEQRSKEIRTFISRKYGKSVSARLQLTTEMESGTQYQNTEAGKVLQYYEPSDFEVCLRNAKAHVVPVIKLKVDEPPGGPQPAKTRRPQAKQPPKDGKTWFQRLLQWLEVAHDAAKTYEELRRKTDARQGGTPDPEPTRPTFLGKVKAWWAGE